MDKIKEKEKEQKVKQPLWKRIIGWISTGFIILIVAGVLGIQINSFINKDKNYGVNMIFGNATLIVLTDSMDPTYPVGGAIFIQKIDGKDVKVGDDLTFYYDAWKMVVTHRVETIVEGSDGIYTFTLHGINANSNQCSGDCTGQTQTITSDKVIGKVIGSSVAFGAFYSFVSSPLGLILILLIPAGYLIVVSTIDIYKALKKKEDGEDNKVLESSKTPKTSSNGKLSEKDKERLKQQLLAEMLKEKMSDKEKDNKEDN